MQENGKGWIYAIIWRSYYKFQSIYYVYNWRTALASLACVHWISQERRSSLRYETS